MCGIVGVISNTLPIDKDLLIRMRDTLIHRGPDDEGIWISPNRNVGLAHRRLSIIDLSQAARQPMSDEERKIWVVFNGEIYNFQEIRIELEKKGYKFRTNSDTEVIIYSYKEWGTNCLQKFNGMFAFGIWDDYQKLLILARDRIGKKPLYLSKYREKFIFASEIKAILEDKNFDRKINLSALNFYFSYGYIPAQMSIFKNIQKLPPAHYALLSLEGNLQVTKYWDIPQEENLRRKTTEDDLLLELEELLTDAVKKRMLSDVPLGAFLSGGIDSSLVVAIMSKISGNKVKTFSIGFENDSISELPYARIVSKYFATQHREFTVKPDSIGILDTIAPQFDEPFADSSLIPTYYVAKMTRQEVTVALSGDGGDELFGGYDNYLLTLRDERIIKFIPYFLRSIISGTAYLLPDNIKGERFLKRLRYDFKGNFTDRHLIFRDFQRKKLFNAHVKHELGGTLSAPEVFMAKSILSKSLAGLSLSDFHLYLPDDILLKVDRMSMLNSLEVRAPFLDYRIAEFSFLKVPDDFKIKNKTRKYLLKKLAKKILPEKLKLDRKRGFSLPIKNWFNGDWAKAFRTLLEDSKDEFINKRYLSDLLKLNRLNLGDHAKQMFSAMMYLIWRERFL